MDITELIGETTEYDKKQAVELRKPKSWCKSVSAFANGNGGRIIFGIADDNAIIGLENAEHDAEKISEKIKERLNPIPDTNLTFKMTDDGKCLIVLEVFAGYQTPYYYAADGQLIAFHRVGNESVPVTPSELRDLILRGSNSSYDSLPSSYALDNMAFTKLKSVYKNKTGLSFDDTDYESFGIIDGTGHLTNAGALLADESPIRHSRVFCTRWSGLDKAGGVVDALDDKEYSGSLVILLQEAYNFVIRNSKKAWVKTSDSRVELPEYPERAVLEGIVNALIHRSYTEIGSEVHIDMYDDRLEIYSPGGMCDGSRVQDLDLNHVASKRRNPILADIFSRLKYMDRRGSGFKKILKDYANHPLYNESVMPQMRSENNAFYLVLSNLVYKKASDKKTSDKKTSDKKASDKKTGDKRQARKTIDKIERICSLLKENGAMTNKEIADILDISLPRSRAILNSVPGIQTIGGRRNRKYTLGD